MKYIKYMFEISGISGRKRSIPILNDKIIEIFNQYKYLLEDNSCITQIIEHDEDGESYILIEYLTLEDCVENPCDEEWFDEFLDRIREELTDYYYMDYIDDDYSNGDSQWYIKLKFYKNKND